MGKHGFSSQGCLIEFRKISSSLQSALLPSRLRQHPGGETADVCEPHETRFAPWDWSGAGMERNGAEAASKFRSSACFHSRAPGRQLREGSRPRSPQLRFGSRHSSLSCFIFTWTSFSSLSGLGPALPHLPHCPVFSLPLVSLCLPFSFFLKVTPSYFHWGWFRIFFFFVRIFLLLLFFLSAERCLKTINNDFSFFFLSLPPPHLWETSLL